MFLCRTFLFHKRFFVAEMGSLGYDKVGKEWFIREPKIVFLWQGFPNGVHRELEKVYELVHFVYQCSHTFPLNLNYK